MKILYKNINIPLLTCSILYTVFSIDFSFAQKTQGIGTNKPHPRAVLELKVEDAANYPQGFLLPKLSTSERLLLNTVAGLPSGMSVYDTDDKAFYIWDGTSWKTSGSLVSIAGISGVNVNQNGQAFTITGTSNQWISSSGNQIYTNSFVGIGTSNPKANFDITNAGNTGMVISATGTGNEGYITISGLGSQQIYFEKPLSGIQWKIGREPGSDDFRIGNLANNYLNITTSNDFILSNLNNFYINNNFQVDVNGNIVKINGVTTNFPNTVGGANTFLRNDGSGILNWVSIPTSQWISSSGNQIYTNSFVGIGLSTPNALLQFPNTNSNRKIVLHQDANNDYENYGFGITTGTLMYTVGSTTGRHTFYAGTSSVTNTELMSIQGDGNVLIGIGIPNEKLTVQGNGSVAGIGYFGTIIGNNLAGAAGSIVTVDGVGRLGVGSIPSNTSQWLTTTSGNIYFPGSKIGIGTDPQYDFHIYNGLGGPYLRLQTPSTAMSFSVIEFQTGIYDAASPTDRTDAIWQIGFVQQGTVSAPEDRIYFGRSGISSTDMGIYRDGNVGIGIINTWFPNERLTVQGNASITGIGYFSSISGLALNGAAAGSVVTVDGAGKLGFGTIAANNNWVNNGINSTHMTGGNVGINIANPTNARLEVGGNNTSTSSSGAQEVARFGSNDNNLLRLGIWIKTDPTVDNQYMALNAISAGKRNLLLQSTGGNVSIGTSLPNEKLLVEGNASVTGIGYFSSISGLVLNGAVAGSVVTVDGAGKLGFGAFPSSTTQWTTSSSDLYYNSGNVAIGSTFTPNASNPILLVTGDRTTIAPDQIVVGGAGVNNDKQLLIGYNTTGNYGVIQSVQQLVSVTPLILQSNGGNVGMGTTNPNERLTVQGNASITGIGYFSSISGLALNGATAGSVVTVDGAGKLGFGTLNNASQWNTLGSDIYYTTGSVGIGTPAPSSFVANDVFKNVGSPASNTIYYGTRAIANIGTSATDVTAVGIAGIAQTNDDVNIGVKGEVNAFAGVNYGGYFSASGGGTNNIGAYFSAIGGTNNYAAIFEGGNVGIGISSPTSNLHINGASNTDIKSEAAAGFASVSALAGSTSISMFAEASGTGGIGTNSNEDFYFRTNLIERVRISANGNVGIGTNTPVAKLDINGSARINGLLTLSGLAGAGNYSLGINANGEVVTTTGSSQWITTTNGIYYPSNIAIGVAKNPSYALEIEDANSNLVYGVGNLRIAAKQGTSFEGLVSLKGDGASDWYLEGNYSSNPTNPGGFNIRSGIPTLSGVNIFNIDVNGKVGIGKSNPSYILDVLSPTSVAGQFTGTSASSPAILRIQNAGAGGAAVAIASGSEFGAFGVNSALQHFMYSGTSNKEYLNYVPTTEKLTLGNSSGNLVINTSATGIGTNAFTGNEALRISSYGGMKGFVLPYVTTAQMVALSAAGLSMADQGMLFWDTNSKDVAVWDGNSFMSKGGNENNNTFSGFNTSAWQLGGNTVTGFPFVTTTGYAKIGINEKYNLAIVTDNIPRMYVSSAGGIGININNNEPRAALQVNGDIGLGDGTSFNNKAVTIFLKNVSGSPRVIGEIVVISPTPGAANDDGFTVTNISGNNSAVGVLTEACPNNSVCKVAISGVVNVIADVATVRGQHVITGSTTSGRAGSTPTPNPGASIGIWLQDGIVAGGLARVLLK